MVAGGSVMDAVWYTVMICTALVYGAWVGGGYGFLLGLAFLVCLLLIDTVRGWTQ